MSDPATAPAALTAAATGEDAPVPLPAAPAASTPQPPEHTAASVSELSVASSDGGDAPAAAQRAMSYEEFRRFYVATRQAKYTSNSTTNRAAPGTGVGAMPAQGATGGWSADAAAGTVRRRVQGLFDPHAGEGMGARAGPPPAAAAAAPPPAPPPAADPRLLARGAAVAGNAVNWLAHRVMRNRGHFIQLVIVFAALYMQRGLSATFLVGLLGLYLVVAIVQAVIRNFEVAHEAGAAAAAPSFLGRLFKPEGHTGPVSAPRRAGYIAAKCLEAFVLSFFPMYSVERLERELGADGIVR